MAISWQNLIEYHSLIFTLSLAGNQIMASHHNRDLTRKPEPAPAPESHRPGHGSFISGPVRLGPPPPPGPPGSESDSESTRTRVGLVSRCQYAVTRDSAEGRVSPGRESEPPPSGELPPTGSPRRRRRRRRRASMSRSTICLQVKWTRLG